MRRYLERDIGLIMLCVKLGVVVQGDVVGEVGCEVVSQVGCEVVGQVGGDVVGQVG